jgi:hypothetical protein
MSVANLFSQELAEKSFIYRVRDAMLAILLVARSNHEPWNRGCAIKHIIVCAHAEW